MTPAIKPLHKHRRFIVGSGSAVDTQRAELATDETLIALGRGPNAGLFEGCLEMRDGYSEKRARTRLSLANTPFLATSGAG